MLCSSSQFSFHYAHTTIPIMPALWSIIQKLTSYRVQVHFRSTLSTIRNYGEPYFDFATVRTRLSTINSSSLKISTCVHVKVILTTSSPIMLA